MIVIKNKNQIANIKVAGNIIAQIVLILDEYLHEGLSTAEIDTYVHGLIIKEGGTPAFLGYNGYKASTCISVNEQIIHGIPTKTNIIKKGDVVSIDIGVNYQGGIADSAHTYYLSDTPPPEDINRLITNTQIALQKGIEAMRPNAHLSDISKAIQSIANKEQLGIVREYCGHGVGVALHEPPEIPNYHPSHGANNRLKKGMVLAIEPMFTLGSPEIAHLDDNFTVISKDNSLAAHFEHTVLVTEDGYKILTA